MPFALFLQENFQVLTKGAATVAPWETLVRIERILIDRARSAFLVHWFGERLPVFGSNVLVWIGNLGELQVRYRRVLAQSRFQPESISLVEPVAGLVGNLAGMLLSPAGAITVIYGVLRLIRNTIGHIALALPLAILGGPFLTGLGVGLGVPISLSFGLFAGLTQAAAPDATVQAVLGLIAALTRALDAFNVLFGQLLGPRDQVRNPLLRSILDLLDGIAGLLAHLLAFAAIVVTRVGPLVLPWAREMLAFKNLIPSVVEMLTHLVTSAVDRISGMIDDPSSPLYLLRPFHRVLAAIEEALPSMLGVIATLLLRAAALMIVGALRALPDLASWLGTVGGLVARHVLDHYVFRQILGLIAAVRTVIDIFQPLVGSGSAPATAPSTPAPSSSSSSPSILPPMPTLPQLPSRKDVDRQIGGPPPMPLSLGAIEKVADLLPRDTIDKAFGLTDPGLAKLIKDLRRDPPSVFGGEHARIRRELVARGRGPTIGDAFKQIRLDEVRLRRLLFDVVGHVLPPAVRAQHFPALLDAFRDIDHYIYDGSRRQRVATEPDFPVRELPDNGRLQPQVGTLRIAASGWNAAELEAFRDRLVARLQRDDYRVDAATPPPPAPTVATA